MSETFLLRLALIAAIVVFVLTGHNLAAFCTGVILVLT